MAFADNDPQKWGRSVDGIAVHSPADAGAEWGKRAAFVISIWPSRATDTYLDRERALDKLGCVKVIPYLSLLWTEPAAYLPHFSLDAPHSILAEAALIRRCAGLWADQESAESFLGILRWRLLADFRGIPTQSSHEQYFPDDLFQVGPHEVFVDCGAFDGDTIRALPSGWTERFRVVGAGTGPAEFCEAASLSGRLGQPRLVDYCLTLRRGSAAGNLRFSATGTEMASVTSEGCLTVEAVPLDELLNDQAPTFIKMDIEGFELEALAGAVEIIRRFRPIMAITVYHHSDHLWKVPLAIASAADPQFDTRAPAEYSFYLRSYQTEFWETVCYAVPRSRRLP